LQATLFSFGLFQEQSSTGLLHFLRSVTAFKSNPLREYSFSTGIDRRFKADQSNSDMISKRVAALTASHRLHHTAHVQGESSRRRAIAISVIIAGVRLAVLPSSIVCA
jgi:hypothetical protein